MALFNFGSKNTDDAQEPDAIAPAQQVTNDDLLGLWRTFSLKQDEANMGAFLEALVEQANLITFAMGEGELGVTADGHLDFERDLAVQFPLLTGADDKTFQPFFTDWQAAQMLLDQWEESGNHDTVAACTPVVVNFEELTRLLGGNEEVAGAVINPFEDNITMDRASLMDLAQQAAQRHDDEDQPVHIGDGRKAPEGLLETLVDRFVADGQVVRAWIRTLTMGEAQSFFLILDMPARDDQDQFFDQLNALAHDYLEQEDIGLTIAPYSEELEDAVAGAVPFYAQ